MCPLRAAQPRGGRNQRPLRRLEEARNRPEGKPLCAAIWRRLDAAEDAYWKRCTAPMQKAAAALALTPAPDLEALRAKIAVMREQALEELDRMPRCPLEVLEEDVARLSRWFS